MVLSGPGDARMFQVPYRDILASGDALDRCGPFDIPEMPVVHLSGESESGLTAGGFNCDFGRQIGQYGEIPSGPEGHQYLSSQRKRPAVTVTLCAILSDSVQEGRLVKYICYKCLWVIYRRPWESKGREGGGPRTVLSIRQSSSEHEQTCASRLPDQQIAVLHDANMFAPLPRRSGNE